ncbi:DUF397 domain-containing protein [Pseudonocardia spinosispora]|uniref:DUF397 domain-containing protein n=1 Tax=Pseudonocardia spinosispora TaxID=103441 RepID=UPI0003F5A102|nr:DUF397 domain-containing protein [Pseudonocardia spinosispora]
MDLAQANWRKSTFSGGNGNSCVEMAFLSDDTVAVRDTKDRALPAHRYAATEWHALLAGVRAGEFDRA